jgi:hypothetical protein
MRLKTQVNVTVIVFKRQKNFPFGSSARGCHLHLAVSLCTTTPARTLTQFPWRSLSSLDARSVPVTLTQFPWRSLSSFDARSVPLTPTQFPWRSLSSLASFQHTARGVAVLRPMTLQTTFPRPWLRSQRQRTAGGSCPNWCDRRNLPAAAANCGKGWGASEFPHDTARRSGRTALRTRRLTVQRSATSWPGACNVSVREDTPSLGTHYTRTDAYQTLPLVPATLRPVTADADSGRPRCPGTSNGENAVDISVSGHPRCEAGLFLLTDFSRKKPKQYFH